MKKIFSFLTLGMVSTTFLFMGCATNMYDEDTENSVILNNNKLKSWDMATNNLVSYEESKNVPVALSKTSKNVLVLGIDTVGNSELDLLDGVGNNPLKKKVFDNFINYRNIVAAGRSTNTGVPALLGGWLANPLLWSDNRIDVHDSNENFNNLNIRTDIKQMYNFQNYNQKNYGEFVNSINDQKFDLKFLDTEYFAGGDELAGDSISVEGFKNKFPKVESAFQYWKNTKGSSKNIYENQYKLDYPKLEERKWHHNFFEKMRKNIKTYNGKGKFIWSWSQQLHPGFFVGSPEDPKTPDSKNIQERENNKPVVEHAFSQIDLMFKKMKKDHVWDNTLIFLVSDHGYRIREESIILIKPWKNKNEYKEINNVMLSNYDFPMILKSYLKNDFDSSYYERAAMVRDNLLKPKNNETLGFYSAKPLDPKINKRKSMFNIHHDWTVKKDDTMLNYFNYYGSVLGMKEKPALTWQLNGTNTDLKTDFNNGSFKNVHIKRIKMVNNKVKYGVYNSTSNPDGYKYVKSLDFFPDIRPFYNRDGQKILEKIRENI